MTHHRQVWETLVKRIPKNQDLSSKLTERAASFHRMTQLKEKHVKRLYGGGYVFSLFYFVIPNFKARKEKAY